MALTGGSVHEAIRYGIALLTGAFIGLELLEGTAVRAEARITGPGPLT